MRRTVLSLAAALLAVSASAAAPECPAGAGFEFDGAMSDEFSGTALDSSKWLDWCWTFKGRRGVFVFAADNVAVTNGELVLTSRLARPDDETAEVRQQGGAKYATALVKAKAKSFYGYYECRSKVADAAVSSAFWIYDPLADNLQAKFRPGEKTEEIDIYEIFGRDGDNGEKVRNLYYNTVHQLNTPYLEAVVNGDAVKLPERYRATRVDFDFRDDYHVHGFLWTEQELVWYLDGKETFRRANDVFHRPMYVTFDCEVMKAWAGLPADADLPAAHRVDYFRHWRKR